MKEDKDIPKLKRGSVTGKITVYPPKEIETLYFQGKGNGWDTTKIVREAVVRALMELAEDLQRPAG